MYSTYAVTSKTNFFFNAFLSPACCQPHMNATSALKRKMTRCPPFTNRPRKFCLNDFSILISGCPTRALCSASRNLILLSRKLLEQSKVALILLSPLFSANRVSSAWFLYNVDLAYSMLLAVATWCLQRWISLHSIKLNLNAPLNIWASSVPEKRVGIQS